MTLNQLTAFQIKEQYSSGKATPEEVIASLLAAIKKQDKAINGYAHHDAKVVEERLKNLPKKKGKLWGVPISIKDNICVDGELTTCSSKILDGFKPPYDAHVIENLKAEGAILMGKTNMDEFAFGSSCETSCYGPTCNPHDTQRIPGGSSGGSAAVVAADEAIMALGSDTGGSIRQPASLCGIVGLKPTYGLVSRYGLIAFGSSLDQIGPLTKDVTDSALLLNVIAGYDQRDSTSVNVKLPDFTKSLTKDVKGLKIGIPKEYFIEGIDPEIKKAVAEAIKLYEKLGAKIQEISLPHTEYAVAVYYIVAPSEASSNLARFDAVQYGLRKKAKSTKEPLIDMYKETRGAGFGKEAKRRIMLGTFALSSGYYDAYYLKALKVRTKIIEDFTAAFKEVDAIITPTSPTPAFKIGEKMDDPLSMYLSDIFTIPANLAGIPAISIPCGMTKSNLPIGLQIMAPSFGEETIFKTAFTYEQNTPWHKNRIKLQ